MVAEQVTDVAGEELLKLTRVPTLVDRTMAARLLEEHDILRKGKERPRRQGLVAVYARQMKIGLWQWANGDCLRFGADGVLVDGQHRLAAFLESGLAGAWFELVSGLSQDAVDTLDGGAPRSAADVLAMHGVADSRNIVSCARWVDRYERRTPGKWLATNHASLKSYPELDALLSRHPGIIDSLHEAGNPDRWTGLIPKSWAAFVHYFGWKTDPERANEWVLRLWNGHGGYEGDPVHVLRIALERNARSRDKIERDTLMAMAVKSWLAFEARKSTTPHSIRVRQTDPFPQFNCG